VLLGLSPGCDPEFVSESLSQRSGRTAEEDSILTTATRRPTHARSGRRATPVDLRGTGR
jgi:hypothetical protein